MGTLSKRSGLVFKRAACVLTAPIALSLGCVGETANSGKSPKPQPALAIESAALDSSLAGDPASGGAGTDPFGVMMMYPTKSGGEEWFLSSSPESDARFTTQDTLTRNADGTFKVTGTQVSLNIYTSAGYQAERITNTNRDYLASRGYMQSPEDWRNVEITGYLRLNKALDITDSFTLQARGGRHNSLNGGCEGSVYKGDLRFDGRVRIGKESWHADFDYSSSKTVASPLQGRWIGFKTIMYNLSSTSVKVELYLNDRGDRTSWKKVHELIDNGSWAGNLGICGGTGARKAITWGGPSASFWWDSASDVDIKWLSIREIAGVTTNPTPAPSPTPSRNPSPTASPSASPSPSPSATPTSVPLSAMSFRASDNADGYPASMAGDLSSATQWVCQGNCWLQADLGSVRSVSGVSLSFYRGDERQTNLKIYTSLDGTTFAQAYSGTSSGTSEGLQRFNFSSRKARYVRFVGTGTDIDNHNSILEMRVYAMGSPVPPSIATWSKWTYNGLDFQSSWESLLQPASSPNFSLLIGTPHGGQDWNSENITRSVCTALKSECIVAFGDQDSGVRLNVNRPTEGAYLACSTEPESNNARAVYSVYHSQVAQRISDNKLKLFAEIHGNDRDLTPGTSGRIEVGTKGLSPEDAQYLKNAMLALRSQIPTFSDVEIVIEGLDPITLAGYCTETVGSMKQVPKGLHIEISQGLRDSSRVEYTQQFLIRALQNTSVFLMSQ